MRSIRCWLGHNLKISYAVNKIGQRLVQGVSCRKCSYYQKHSIPSNFYQTPKVDEGETV